MYTLLDFIRSLIPLSIRKKIGPIIGYLVYLFRIHIKGRTWEPQVLSISDTLKKIDAKNLSAIRFGDGEMSLIRGGNLGFQEHDPQLAKSLRSVLHVHNEKLLICIPGIFGNISSFTKRAFWFEIHHLFRYGHLWGSLTRSDQIYGDAFFARPHLAFKDISRSGDYYTLIKKLWLDKDVVLIEGEKSRLGVGNDLFQDVQSLKRILCPAEHAYQKIDTILAEARCIPKNSLILLSLGPTAKVVAYALFREGYRVIDIGHVDMEYEMYQRNTSELIPVPYKYFNEIDERHPEDCTDEKYLSEIIAHIK